MKWGDTYEARGIDAWGKKHYWTAVYRRAQWGNYHTNNEGDGLWYGDKQIHGTCQFTVRGCELEKSAIAKIQRYVKGVE